MHIYPQHEVMVHSSVPSEQLQGEEASSHLFNERWVCMPYKLSGALSLVTSHHSILMTSRT
jgi:hypothetical protein